jgi:hypothetical protein
LENGKLERWNDGKNASNIQYPASKIKKQGIDNN